MAKRFCILMGSPRINGNTAELCKPLIQTLREHGADIRYTALAQLWYCTAEMKALLDRCFSLSKLYRSARGSLWAGKSVAILATHGYDADYAAEPFETGVRRLCEHAKLRYRGMFSVRDTDDLASSQTEAAISGARAFAASLLEP